MVERTYLIGETELRELLERALRVGAMNQNEGRAVYAGLEVLLASLTERAQEPSPARRVISKDVLEEARQWVDQIYDLYVDQDPNRTDRRKMVDQLVQVVEGALSTNEAERGSTPAPARYGDKAWLMAAVADEAAAGDLDPTTGHPEPAPSGWQQRIAAIAKKHAYAVMNDLPEHATDDAYAEMEAHFVAALTEAFKGPHAKDALPQPPDASLPSPEVLDTLRCGCRIIRCAKCDGGPDGSFRRADASPAKETR